MLYILRVARGSETVIALIVYLFFPLLHRHFLDSFLGFALKETFKKRVNKHRR
jgi:hypothetical protein